MPIDNFVWQFNDHQSSLFVGADIVCADESIVHWCGLGGHWINIGSPMCVDIDCEAESGCEIQSACCGKSGITTCTHVVKSKSCHGKDGNGTVTENEGTCDLKELTLPWAKTDQFVVGDSFHASVQAAMSLCHHGLHFTGVAETAAREFPMQCLANKENTKKGEHHGAFHTAKTSRDPDPLAFT